MITKQYQLKDFEVKCEDGKREVISVITTDALDRDNEVLLPKGLRKKNFAGNPVVLLNHDYSVESLVGKCLWLKRDGNRIIAKSYITDKTQSGIDTFGLLQDGILNSVSVGFNPTKQSPPTEREIKERPELANCRNVIREFDLLEYSFVVAPCNPQALNLAVSKGYSSETLKLLNGGVMPEITEIEEKSFDIWKYEDEEEEIIIEKEIALPRYAKSVDEIKKEIGMFASNLSAERMIKRYQGKL